MFGIVMAFQDYKPWLGFFNSAWVGLEHFRTMFEYDYARQVIWNTLVISILKMIFGLFVPITFALLLNEVYHMTVKRTIQTVIYLPYFLSWVILGGILLDLLSPDGGLVNQVIGLVGIDPIFFLGSNDWFRVTIVISDLWKETGFNTIVFLAAITAVNPSLYEAAVVDGADRWKQTLYITLPAMLPIIIVVGTLSLGNILNAGFDQIFNLYNPLVYQTGDIIDTYVYRVSLISGEFSYGTAVGLFKSVISLFLIVLGYRLAYKYANWRIFFKEENPMRLYKTKSYRTFTIINYSFLTLTAILCLLPLVHIFAVSLSGSGAATANLVALWPVDFTVDAYERTLDNDNFIRSFVISVVRVILGTAISMGLLLCAAYSLAKNDHEFKGRKVYMWFFVFTMLFNGGLVPTYMVVTNLGLTNTIWALVLPTAINAFNLILLLNFFSNVRP